MNKASKITLGSLALVGVIAMTANSALAFGGHGKFNHRGGDRPEGLIPTEMKADLKANWQGLSEEERQAFKEERKAHRQEKRAAFVDFVGVPKEDIREVRKNGGSVGDILLENGKTEADAEAFITDRVNSRVDNIVERHDLTPDQEQTIRDRISDFVDRILGRWFK